MSQPFASENITFDECSTLFLKKDLKLAPTRATKSTDPSPLTTPPTSRKPCLPPLLGPPKSEFLDAPAPAKGPNNNATLSGGPRLPDGSTDPGNSPRLPVGRRQITHANNNYSLEGKVFNNHSHRAAGRFAPEGGTLIGQGRFPLYGGSGA